MTNIMEDWDDDPSVVRTSSLSSLCEMQMDLTAALKVVKDKLDKINAQLAAEFPEEIGVQSREVDGYVLTCKRSELWKWDTDGLRSEFDSPTSLPHWIASKLVVSKQGFESLSEREQAYFRKYLTREPGKPSIKVEKP